MACNQLIGCQQNLPINRTSGAQNGNIKRNILTIKTTAGGIMSRLEVSLLSIQFISLIYFYQLFDGCEKLKKGISMSLDWKL